MITEFASKTSIRVFLHARNLSLNSVISGFSREMRSLSSGVSWSISSVPISSFFIAMLDWICSIWLRMLSRDFSCKVECVKTTVHIRLQQDSNKTFYEKIKIKRKQGTFFTSALSSDCFCFIALAMSTLNCSNSDLAWSRSASICCCLVTNSVIFLSICMGS